MSYLSVLVILTVLSTVHAKAGISDDTSLVKAYEENILLLSTLDGHFIATNQLTGNILWKQKDEPAVRAPLDLNDQSTPTIIPDPKDGSLYLLNLLNKESTKDGGGDSLRKLPFTIPQLVMSTPCKSSDGILYTSKKSDQWFLVEPHTGRREKVLGWPEHVNDETCPTSFKSAVYIGRTKYQVLIKDQRDRRLNITFYDYATEDMSKDDIMDYELKHITSSSTGKIATVDRLTGKFLWEHDFDSPVIGIYLLKHTGLVTVPFVSVQPDMIDKLQVETPIGQNLFPTLYIGEHTYGLYAFAAFIERGQLKIKSTNNGPLLLDGPKTIALEKIAPEKNSLSTEVLGYYNVPEFSDVNLQISSRHFPLGDLINYYNMDYERPLLISTQSANVDDAMDGVQTAPNVSEKVKFFTAFKQWFVQQENKSLKLTLVVLCLFTAFSFVHFNGRVTKLQQMSSQNSASQQQHSNVSSDGPITGVSQEEDDGTIRIGKIVFNPNEVLGRGCEGTFVYKGEFDGRSVAVKRLLPECFSLADREVALLRESDAHPNVVRYHCTERDKQFRYIALELCRMSLYDYVMSNEKWHNIGIMDILKQATAGLSHLHSLDIVHRDIKPQNVLLWTSPKGEVRVMISDFGLCKKLQIGHASFSRRSGVTGTDGWIAPEMLNQNNKMTTAVDIFSLGCVFYFVLSNGRHPFGDSLKRQSNILNNAYCFEHLNDVQVSAVDLAKYLISCMIDSNAKSRPTAKAVLAYPLFWSNKRVLSFFQEVSDRVEKVPSDDAVLSHLEQMGAAVVRNDWRMHVDSAVASDLRKYRSYMGHSVRDLLRALRNKKHHYRELDVEAQQSLGSIPDMFTDYWTRRFPLLLLHTWIRMQCVKTEPSFETYYDHTYEFQADKFVEMLPEIEEQDAVNTDQNAETNALFKLSNTEKMSPAKYNKKIKRKTETGEELQVINAPRSPYRNPTNKKPVNDENLNGNKFNKTVNRNAQLNYNWRNRHNDEDGQMRRRGMRNGDDAKNVTWNLPH